MTAYAAAMRIDLQEGFYLDSVREGDQAAYVEHFQDRDTVDRLLKIPFPYTAKDAEDWVRHRLQVTATQTKETSFALRRPDGVLIGGIGFVPSSSAHRAELGYWVARTYRGRGLATAAVKAVVAYGFQELGYRRIEATAFHQNQASFRVLEKAGFRREGLLRGYHMKNGRLIDVCMFSRVEPGHPVPKG
ncbi:MAG: GNAT family N-acetyltransferase [Methylacidiphilales bacterium]|nr:GNAT family N-acetyltransferase [Candidatus Methylacidiphilales bacterium]